MSGRRPTAVASGALLLSSALVLLGAITLRSQVLTLPGEPMPNLTPVEFEEFRLGREDFLEVETAEEGLGPAFNGTSCAVCHNVPAVGGTSAIAEVRAGRYSAPVLDAGPRLPAGHPGPGERHRAACADPGVRGGAGRGDR